MLTQEEIEAIRKRAEVATEGPWFSEEVGKMSRAKWYGVYTDDDDIGVDTTYQADAVFIAHARTDIPKLLAEIERLQEESDKLEELMQEIDTHLRSTPEPLPYIFETMRKYWNYREVTNK